MEGRVKWFDEKKGYGFIETENQGDLFVHIKNVFFYPLPLIKGERVVFEVEKGPRGNYAAYVRSLDIPRVEAGGCCTRTGSRVYFPPWARLAQGKRSYGYRDGRCSLAALIPGSLGLLARWGHGIDFEVVVVEATSKDGLVEVPVGPHELGWEPTLLEAAWQWLEEGRRGRQESYWPDPPPWWWAEVRGEPPDFQFTVGYEADGERLWGEISPCGCFKILGAHRPGSREREVDELFPCRNHQQQ